MHFCTAQVAIAGDLQQTAYRNQYDPISWPEVEVLRFLHGEDAITNVQPFVRVQQPARDERDRLILIYGGEPVERCFPGRSTRDIEMEAADAKVQDGLEWRNPLTNHFEVVGQAAPEPESIPSAAPRQRRPGVQKVSDEKPF